MKMVKDFLTGAGYVFRGCRSFYSDRSAWKYSLWPLATLLVFYVLLYAGVYIFTGFLVDRAMGACRRLPEYLAWLDVCIRWGIRLGSIAVYFTLLAGTALMVYELLGGLFFDGLTDHYERKTFHTEPVAIGWKANVHFMLSAIYFAVRTMVILVILQVFSIFFPVIGPVLTVLIMGYFFGISSMMGSANRNGIRMAELRRIARKKKAAVTGFGATAYVLLLFPLITIFLLPGLVIGGSELRCRELSGEQ